MCQHSDTKFHSINLNRNNKLIFCSLLGGEQILVCILLFRIGLLQLKGKNRN